MTDKTVQDSSLPRRDVLKVAMAGLVAIPVLALTRNAQAQASPVKLDEKDAQAVALGYVADAKKVDVKANPAYKPEQTCASCLQLTGKAGDAYRPCNLFPGKVVSANGWCKAWMKKA
jgi:hypothetical protein